MVVTENPDRGIAVADIQVELEPRRAPAYAAILKLCGEHDIATSPGLREALALIQGSVLVDLSDCAFVDASVLSAFVIDACLRAVVGYRLELAVPEQNRTVMRTLQVSGLTELLTVHATPAWE